MRFEPSPVSALTAIAGGPAETEPRASPLSLADVARLCYFSNGVTKVLRGMPFRAAACTGALYHIELYLVCADLADLEAGVYHYGAHDNGLRQLRAGDFRRAVVDVDAGAPVIAVLTSTWWRNAWKYRTRAYRHAFWDTGTIVANLLAVASAQSIPARTVIGFADGEVNALLDVDPEREAAIALVALGSDGELPPVAPAITPLNLPTRPLSPHQVAYQAIVQAHAESSLGSQERVTAWRSQFAAPASARLALLPAGESIEALVLRRGSSRRFSRALMPLEAVQTLLAVATAPNSLDAFVDTDVYLIVNAVDGLAAGSYVYNRATGGLELLRAGDFRREATYLDLGQQLAGDAAVNMYWLVNLDPLDDRGYRAAQLNAAIEAGKLYLAAYSLGFGATGLTFFDDDVTRFFSPHAAGKSVMFLTAVGVPRRELVAVGY